MPRFIACGGQAGGSNTARMSPQKVMIVTGATNGIGG
jgi:hypothetical protein